MENSLDPEIVRQAAARSLVTLGAFLQRADVSTSTFYRWVEGKVELRPLTKERLRLAVKDAFKGD